MSLLLIEVIKSLYSLNQHEYQLMVAVSHFFSELLPAVRQLREITGKKKKGKLERKENLVKWKLSLSAF